MQPYSYTATESASVTNGIISVLFGIASVFNIMNEYITNNKFEIGFSFFNFCNNVIESLYNFGVNV